jgi:rhodanese-related sulfurtransferase
MVGTITTGHKALMADAATRVTSISPEDALRKVKENNALVVDIRDPREIEREGRIPGSFSAPRGMIEFWIDPDSPYYKPVFGEDRPFIFQCASGWRSLLTTDTVQRMGLAPVLNLEGGLAAWKAAGLPIEMLEPKETKT